MQIAAMNSLTRELNYVQYFLNGCKQKSPMGKKTLSRGGHNEPWEQIRENLEMLDDKFGITEYYCPCHKLGYRVLATKLSDHYERLQGEKESSSVTSFNFDFLSVINRTGRSLITSSNQRYHNDEHEDSSWLNKHVDNIIEAEKTIKYRLPLLTTFVSHITFHSYESYYSWANEMYSDLETQLDEEVSTYNLQLYYSSFTGIRDNIFLQAHKFKDFFNSKFPVMIFHFKPELFDPDLPSGCLTFPYIALHWRYKQFDHEFPPSLHLGEFEPKVRTKIDHINEHWHRNQVTGPVDTIHNELINTYLSGFVSATYMLLKDFIPYNENKLEWIDHWIERLNKQFKTNIFQIKELVANTK